MSGSVKHLPATRSRRVAAALLSTLISASVGGLGLGAGTAHATQQGDNGFIAFQTPVNNLFHIALAHADGSGYHVLDLHAPGMNAAPVLVQPAISPDGSKVAFTESGGSRAIWTANVDGSHVMRISSPPAGGSDSAAAWSPDGTKVFFARQGGTVQIFTAFADGSGGDQKLPPEVSGFSDTTPDVSANGDVAFTRANGPAPGVYVWSPKTNTLTLIADKGTSPSFNPLGTLIAFTGAAPGNNTQIEFRAATGIGAVTAIPGTLGGSEPSWSPDGFKITYQNGGAQGLHLHVVDVNSNTISNVQTGVPAGMSELVPSWQSMTNTTIDRLGGPDRIDTAIATSHLGYNNAGSATLQAGGVVLTRSDSFADALAGSALAAKTHAPLLLTPTGGLDSRVATELRRVLKPGGQVTLLGGTDALSAHVESQVAALGFTTRRLAGPDRYATAVAIADATTANPARILVATGNNFPDALAAGAASGTAQKVGKDTVVLLSNDRQLPGSTAAYVSAHANAAQLFGVGDQGAEALQSMFPADHVIPVAGTDRYATAAAVAHIFFNGPTSPASIGVAVGDNWPDALSGGALLGTQGAPLLLANKAAIPGVEADYAETVASSVNTVLAFGGTDVMPNAAVFTLTDESGLPGHRFNGTGQ